MTVRSSPPPDGAARRSEESAAGRVAWVRCLPFFGMHAACLGVFWTGWSEPALLTAAALYVLRMFAITGFYHRYFAHHSFRTSRPFQFLMAVAGATAVQGDPLWWASHHFEHHAHSDDERDPHSPARLGFWRSHVGWFLTPQSFRTRERFVRDWLAYPELRWLRRFDKLPGALLAAAVFALGWALEIHAPELGADRWQLLFWGFFVSTVAVYHATFTINSLAHQFGSQRYETKDHSRNNWLLALLTLGEGWHNNHHHYPGAARQGFYWWEVDISYYLLRFLAWCGLVWDLRPVPEKALAQNRTSQR